VPQLQNDVDAKNALQQYLNDNELSVGAIDAHFADVCEWFDLTLSHDKSFCFLFWLPTKIKSFLFHCLPADNRKRSGYFISAQATEISAGKVGCKLISVTISSWGWQGF
jgi:hypothetical protein